MERFHEAGITVIPVVLSKLPSQRMEKWIHRYEWKLGTHWEINNMRQASPFLLLQEGLRTGGTKKRCAEPRLALCLLSR